MISPPNRGSSMRMRQNSQAACPYAMDGGALLHARANATSSASRKSRTLQRANGCRGAPGDHNRDGSQEECDQGDPSPNIRPRDGREVQQLLHASQRRLIIQSGNLEDGLGVVDFVPIVTPPPPKVRDPAGARERETSEPH